MSPLFDRVKTLPNICGIEVSFTGTMVPSTIEGYQVFTNSLPDETEFTPAHFGRASVDFSESSQESNAGISWKQTLVIQFPVSDSSRADRLEAFLKSKFIKIKLANQKDLVLGRNDYFQNTRPKVSVKSDERLAQVQFETQSITPCGYTPNFDAAGLPAFFPINFIID
jgi:hypothetical protein